MSIEVYSEGKKEPVEIIRNALDYARENNFDYILIDTAGRLQIDEKLMAELQGLEESFKPHETLLVIDSMMGQDAINVITGFNEKIFCRVTNCIYLVDYLFDCYYRLFLGSDRCW